MQETTEKLEDRAIEDLYPLAKKLAEEGYDKDRIANVLKVQMHLKVKHLYEKENAGPKSLAEIIKPVMNQIGQEPADSKAEKIFYNMLTQFGFTFEFQYPIGPYRADYLFDGFLVVELDGPYHKAEKDEKRDQYMRKMGYKIIRVPIWVLASCPEAVIEEIATELVREKKNRKKS